MNKTLKFATCVFFLSICACGSLEDFVDTAYMDKQQNPSDVIVKLTENEQAQGLAKPHSYIVTFKAIESNQTTKFKNFLSETKNFHDEIVGSYIDDPRISSMSFLTSLELGGDDNNDFNITNFIPAHLRHVWGRGIEEKYIAAIVQVDFNNDEDASSVLQGWSRDGKILFAEPNYTSKLSGPWGEAVTAYEKTNETSAYWFRNIRLFEAFRKLDSIPNSSSDSPIIAVLDSGLTINHPLLAKRLWQNSYVGLSSCGSDDLHGCNTVVAAYGTLGHGDVTPKVGCTGEETGSCSHGTHVTGIIAGGVTETSGGICPMCLIMSLRIVNDSGVISDSSIIRALKYVTLFQKEGNSAVRVINASFGKFVRSRAVATLIRKLKDTPANKGALVIAAAGNEDTNKYSYPASLPEAIAVSNVDSSNLKSPSSNFGRWVDIAAPGTDIIATIPSGGTTKKTGTSMAAPIVAGVAGLVLAADPNISYSDLKSAILSSAEPSQLYASNQDYLVRVTATTGQIPLLGAGVVNALKAVSREKNSGQYVVSAEDRVTGFCGTVNGEHPNSALSKFTVILILLMPLLVCKIAHIREPL